MPLSTEVFVMVIFIAGYPFFYVILHNMKMKGRLCFLWAYGFLTLSNIATVIEEFWWNAFFNGLEHLFITTGSIMMLIAVTALTERDDRQGMRGANKSTKGGS